MPDAILTFEAEEAQKELQKLFKKRKNALEKDPNHVWDHFDVVKVATSSTTPQKFQINLKCKWCSKTVSASNPAQSMPRHLKSSNCIASGNSAYYAMEKRQKEAKRTAETAMLSPAEENLLESLASEATGASDGASVKRQKTGKITENLIVNIPQAAKDIFMEKFCRWVVVRSSTLSFNVVEDKLLKEAFQTLGLPPPDRKKISGKFLDEEFKRVVDSRAKKLEELDCYQLAGDSWKSHVANDGDKMMASTVTLPTGGALVGGFQGIKGAEKQDADFIFEFYKDLIEKLGSEKCAGVVFDGEASYQCAAKKLEEHFPRMCNIHCQAHVLSLLIKDLIKEDTLLKWVIEGIHSIIVFINSHKDVQAELREAQDLFYEEIRAIPVGVETRFATAILELHSVLRNMDAVRALFVVSSLKTKYDAPGSAANGKEVFTLLKNDNFWQAAKQYDELLFPIANAIHHAERDSACVSQLPRLWSKIQEHFVAWYRKHRILGMFMSDDAFTMPADAIPAVPDVLMSTLEKRRKKNWNPVFSLAMMLDLRFAVKDGTSFKPNMALIDEEEHEAVNLLLRRLVGEEKADAAEVELLRWVAEGSSESMINAILNKATYEQGWFLVDKVETVRLVWKGRLFRSYPILSELAQRLLSMHATSCSCERLWSLMRWIYRPNRTRLSLDKAEKMATVTFDEWLERRDWREDFSGNVDSLIESVIELD